MYIGMYGSIYTCTYTCTHARLTLARCGIDVTMVYPNIWLLSCFSPMNYQDILLGYLGKAI